MGQMILDCESVCSQLSFEYLTALVDDMIDAYQACADHEYWDLVGAWIGGGPL